MYSEAGTLFHRANTICSTPQLLQEEEDLFKALTRCKYPTWAIKRAKMKSQNPNTRRTQTGQNTNQNNLYMVVPYHQGLSERIKRMCNKFGFKYISKEDRPYKQGSYGVIYRYKCSEHGAMQNTLVNLLGILQIDSKNTKSPLPPFFTITTSQIITSTSPI